MKRMSLIAAALMMAAGCCTMNRPADKPVWDVGKINGTHINELTQMKTFEDGGVTLNYRLHQPNVLKNTKYPLFIFLHGAGERGDNNTRQLVHGVPQIVKYAMKHGDAFVLAPQCPDNHKWVNVSWSEKTMVRPENVSVDLGLVMKLVDKMIAENKAIDKDRIYVSGISMGGFGTWDYVSRRPELFAAAMPICGGVDPAIAPIVKNVNLKFFHGGADNVVTTDYSRRMVVALANEGVKADYTEYPGVGHDSWTRTYANDEVLSWIFSQSK